VLRAVKALLLVTFFISHACAEDVMLLPRWSAITAAPKGPASKSPAVIRVQEPYCGYGVGLCGGTCSEDGGKHWDCASTELPCYQLGHCKCEAASVCKPPPPKKKK
jgi:hypothetical protein